MSARRSPEFDTIILAGGKATRMGGADKPSLEVSGEPMLVSVARAAAAAGTARLIVVGPPRGGAVGRGLEAIAALVPGGVVTVREEPAGAGPVAAVRRGLTEVSAPWAALLAADLPFLTGAWLTALLALAAAGPSAGAILVDDGGRAQWLAGCWRAGVVRVALAGYGGQSLGGVLGPLEPAQCQPGQDLAAPWLDCDSQEELAAARAGRQPRHRPGRNGAT
jgi:molybdopterin-guanine dinucleotide biosynthesis protein A